MLSAEATPLNVDASPSSAKSASAQAGGACALATAGASTEKTVHMANIRTQRGPFIPKLLRKSVLKENGLGLAVRSSNDKNPCRVSTQVAHAISLRDRPAGIALHGRHMRPSAVHPARP